MDDKAPDDNKGAPVLDDDNVNEEGDSWVVGDETQEAIWEALGEIEARSGITIPAYQAWKLKQLEKEAAKQEDASPGEASMGDSPIDAEVSEFPGCSSMAVPSPDVDEHRLAAGAECDVTNTAAAALDWVEMSDVGEDEIPEGNDEQLQGDVTNTDAALYCVDMSDIEKIPEGDDEQLQGDVTNADAAINCVEMSEIGKAEIPEGDDPQLEGDAGETPGGLVEPVAEKSKGVDEGDTPLIPRGETSGDLEAEVGNPGGSSPVVEKQRAAVDGDEGGNTAEEKDEEELPFECETCGRAFRTKRGLGVHKRVHKPGRKKSKKGW